MYYRDLKYIYMYISNLCLLTEEKQSETICINKYENWEAALNIALYSYTQGCNVRKVNCGCVYSAYILKPVLSGRNL